MGESLREANFPRAQAQYGDQLSSDVRLEGNAGPTSAEHDTHADDRHTGSRRVSAKARHQNSLMSRADKPIHLVIGGAEFAVSQAETLMIEDNAQVQVCLLKVETGDWTELRQYQIDVLLTAGLIQRFDVFQHAPLDASAPRFEYQLTKAGRDTLWPPRK